MSIESASRPPRVVMVWSVVVFLACAVTTGAPAPGIPRDDSGSIRAVGPSTDPYEWQGNGPNPDA